MRVLIIALLVTASGCATSSKSFKPSNLDSDEGVYYGKVSIVMDGEEITGNCYFQTWDKDENPVHLSLDDSGLFVGKGLSGKVHLKRLHCRKGMVHHQHEFDNDEIHFYNQGNGKKTYFGDITVHWKSGGFNPAVFLLGAGVAGAIGPKVKNMVFTIEDNIKSTTKLYKQSIAEQDSLKTKKDTFRFPAGSLVTPEQAQKIHSN